jgi:acyl-homoserine-lactone acylase
MRRGTGFAMLPARARQAVLLIGLLLVAIGLALFGSPVRAHGLGVETASADTLPSETGLRATIRRTTHGVPHILANDYAGLGYGFGYSIAQDNICVIADTYVTVDAQRSRYFGPDASYTVGGNGSVNNNLNSDFFYQRIIDNGTIENLLSLDAPRGPRPEIKEIVRGYAAGYNRYLNDTGVENLPDASCRGAAWVHPITEIEVFRRFYQLGLIASQGVAIDGIGGAQPPAGPVQQPTAAEQDRMIGDLEQKLPLGGIGSNALALGKDATDNGKGMMLGNPHFPWDGSERFYEAQLTIPGVMNAEGGMLFGVPLVLIGHTDNLAWSHTVSTGFRFTPFEEALVPGSPTTYIYDGQPRQMKADDVTVMAKRADGTLEPRTRTLYSTHHGPIFDSLLGLDIFPWTEGHAFSMGDANANNFRYLNHFFEVNHAQSTNELDDILHRNQGIPWVNTLASDSAGKAYYADISVVPNVSNSKAAVCNTAVGNGTFQALGLPVLDGSRSACEWDTDPDAIEPGIFGPSHLPRLVRDDYVENSNDSYWLSNPNEPLEGFARIIGDERTERALRTRSGLVMIEQRLAGTDGWPGNRYTLQQLQDTVFANRQYAGELWRDELADFCEATPTMTGSNGPVDVSAACPVLRAWDLHDNLDSNGAILFRRFASRALGAVPVVGTPGLFTTQFDANDPVHTPSGLNVANPAVEQSFADAVTDLRNAGIPLDAPLRGWQYERRGSERIPIHGGPGSVGVFNAINVGWVGSGSNPGYPNVPHGSSYVYTAQFTGGDCPVNTRSILTYSLSTNPASPYFADQTRMFSGKQWVDEAYCDDEIAADPNLQTTTIAGPPGYARPKGATPILVSLVTAYKECTASNRQHGPPLASLSCGSPQPSSDRLTVGTLDANGKPARSAGTVRFDAFSCPACASPLPNADVRIAASLTDVRNRSDLSDYAGDLELRFANRLTDRFNGPIGGSEGTDPATSQDITYRFAIPCAATGDDAGGACQTNTTMNAVVPGGVRAGDRAIWQVGSVGLYDPDGALFATQGIFTP